MINFSTAGKPNDKANADRFMPALLSFGPVFMCIGLIGTASSHGVGSQLFSPITALAGAGCLSWGLGLLLMRQNRIVQHLAELEALKNLR